MKSTTGKPFWQSANFWHNLLALLSTIFISVEAQSLITTAHDVVGTVFAQPIQITAIITAAFTLINMVWHLFIKPKPDPVVEEEKIKQVVEKVMVEKANHTKS